MTDTKHTPGPWKVYRAQNGLIIGIGVDRPNDEDGRLQEDAAAIARLHVRGLLTATETRNAERRLVKRLLPLTPSSPERNDG
jgi:hypothetical protein